MDGRRCVLSQVSEARPGAPGYGLGGNATVICCGMTGENNAGNKCQIGCGGFPHLKDEMWGTLGCGQRSRLRPDRCSQT